MKNKKGIFQLLGLLMNPLVLILIVVVLGLLFIPGMFRSLAIGFDDFLVFDDFEDGIVDANKYEWNRPTSCEASQCRSTFPLEENGKLVFRVATYAGGSPTQEANFDIKENFGGKDVKITAECLPYWEGMFGTNKLLPIDCSQPGGCITKWVVNGNSFIGVSRGGNKAGCAPPTATTLEITQSLLEPNEYLVEVNGADVGIFTSDDIFISIQGGFSLDSIKFRVPFDCRIEPDEVVVKDKFSEGSEVSIRSLTYSPTKMCLDIAPVVRDFEKQGLQRDERGEILASIGRGETLIVPANQQYDIFYITPFVDTMEERCSGLEQAYDTQLKRCITVVEQIEPIVIILQCQETSDCFLPTWKCGEELTVECAANQCQYSQSECTPQQIINEIIVYKKIIEQVNTDIYKTIVLGWNEISFRHTSETKSTVEFGDLTFTSSRPDYISGCNQISTGYINNPECFTVDINFGGQSHRLTANKQTDLNEFISVRWLFEGRGVKYREAIISQNFGDFDTNEHWGNLFVFTVDTTEVFDLIKPTGEPIEILLNSDKIVPLTVVGNMANFNNKNSGFIVETDYQLIHQPSSTDILERDIFKGTNTYDISVKTEQLGIVVYTISPYFDIIADKPYRFRDDKTLKIGYNIVQRLTGECPRDSVFDSTIGACVFIIQEDCADVGCPSGFDCAAFEGTNVCKEIGIPTPPPPRNIFQRFIDFFKNLFKRK